MQEFFTSGDLFGIMEPYRLQRGGSAFYLFFQCRFKAALVSVAEHMLLEGLQDRKEDFIREQLELTGYFVILTNDSKDPEYILNIYRTKDVVEKSFDNIKNEFDLERLRIHSDKAMEGRIFIGFMV